MQPKGGMVGSDYILVAALFQYPQLSTDKGASFSSLLDTGSWYGAAMGDSGQHMLLAASNGYFYTSNNYGATFTPYTSAGYATWRNPYISPDGTRQLVVANGGYLYISSTSGQYWNYLSALGTGNWYAAAISNNGTYITVVEYGGRYVRVSSNGGGSFSMVDPSYATRNWVKVAMSTTGQFQVIVAEYDFSTQVYTPIYTSSDYGATWTARSTENQSWKSVCMSNIGQVMYAVCPTKVFKSADYGATWSEVYVNTNVSMVDIQCTSDGQVVYALGSSGEIIASADGGTNWQLITTTVPNAKNIAISNVL